MQETGPFTQAPRLTDDALIAADGARLPLRKWLPEGPPKAVVAALHGFNDYSLAFEAPGQAWAMRGIATYAIDQRGFGAAPRPGIWAGKAAMARDLAALAETLRERHPDTPLYLAGESMGGAVVMAVLGGTAVPGLDIRADIAVDGAVLIAPAVWGRRHLGWFKNASLWLSAHTVPWFEVTAEGLEIRPSDNREMLIRLARDPLVIKSTRIDAIWGVVNLMDAAYAAAPRIGVPVLLLYGTRDEIIPPAPTREAIAALKAEGRARAAFYPTGYHMLLRDLDAAVPVGDAAAWMLDPMAPLPSGADRRTPAREAD